MDFEWRVSFNGEEEKDSFTQRRKEEGAKKKHSTTWRSSFASLREVLAG
jgi:hypothetical protein